MALHWVGVNRTDRLLAIVLELQGRGVVRAEDLARHFEVSRRTIYRDVLVLNGAGVPIVSRPGHGYGLMPGYFLPPLHLGADEAMMLLLGSDVVAQALDPDLAAATATAARKIMAVLGEDVRAEVQFLRENLRLVGQDPGGETTQGTLRLLRQAIVARRPVAFAYHKPQAGTEGRTVEPHGLFRLNGVWLLAAFDPARADFRTFRLDRMERARFGPGTFVRRPGFRLARDETREGRVLVVQALFAPQVARLVGEQPSYYVTQTRETPEGLLVTLRSRTADEVLPWLLSWGDRVRVLEPAAVRDRLRDAARAVAALYP